MSCPIHIDKSYMCPQCGFMEFFLTETRITRDGRRRRRRCNSCGFKKTTYELDEETYKDMVKKRIIAKRVLKAVSASLVDFVDEEEDQVPAQEVEETFCDSCQFSRGISCSRNKKEFFNTDSSIDCPSYKPKVNK